MAKPNDLPPAVQAAAIISATQIALKPKAAQSASAIIKEPTPEVIVQMAIEILNEYAKHHDIGD
jgi:hypothetical protein